MGATRKFRDLHCRGIHRRLTQHIPHKHFQMVRYSGWYSSRSRGERTKAGLFRPGDEPTPSAVTPEVTVLVVSDYKPPRVPSRAGKTPTSPETTPHRSGGDRATDHRVVRTPMEHRGHLRGIASPPRRGDPKAVVRARHRPYHTLPLRPVLPGNNVFRSFPGFLE